MVAKEKVAKEDKTLVKEKKQQKPKIIITTGKRRVAVKGKKFVWRFKKKNN